MAWPRRERVVSFINNRWLVFVAAMWIQSCAGIGYLFGSISPVIKSSLNYNQKQLSRLGVAKDLGDSVGFLAGTLSEILPLWAALLVGAVQNLVGYGWVWLIVTGRAPILPLWASDQNQRSKRMPGIRGPSEYSQEPARHPSLKINAKEPFNAEPPRSALVSSYVTPVDLFYKRNHGPIPIVDDLQSYSVVVTGLIDNPRKLFMKDIRALPKYNVTATLQCAGNRRTAMSKVRNVRGVGWDVSAIGNAVWAGAKLADVLELLGIPKLTASTNSGGRHVEFVSVDRCKEENGGPYKASIPLSQATNPEADVLLAYEMNGETLNRDHGFPLRVVVPGVIGARSVKWLDSINVIAEECQGFFMQKDYKMFPPSVNWDNIDWSSRRPQMDFPVQSAICSLEDVQMVKPGKLSIKGYAVSGGGRGIERVDISLDGGINWVEASRTQKPGMHYMTEHESSDKWAWVLFEATVDVSQTTEVIAKAVDSAANVQPENVESVWNLRGVLNTSWHRVLLRLGHSNL